MTAGGEAGPGSLDRLPAYRPEVPVCVCGAFRPEALVPVGDSAVGMCWLCAHLVTEHGVEATQVALMGAMDRCSRGELCACKPTEVYPGDVLREREAVRQGATAAARAELGRDVDDPVLPAGWTWRSGGAGVDASGGEPAEVEQADTHRLDRVVRSGQARRLRGR